MDRSSRPNRNDNDASRPSARSNQDSQRPCTRPVDPSNDTSRQETGNPQLTRRDANDSPSQRPTPSNPTPRSRRPGHNLRPGPNDTITFRGMIPESASHRAARLEREAAEDRAYRQRLEQRVEGRITREDAHRVAEGRDGITRVKLSRRVLEGSEAEVEARLERVAEQVRRENRRIRDSGAARSRRGDGKRGGK